MNTPWVKIMAEFRGRRLAVHDDIARGRALDLADSNVQNALGWLAYHHLVWRNATGQLQARDASEAQHHWRNGPAKNASEIFSAQVAERPNATTGDNSPSRASVGEAGQQLDSTASAGSNPALCRPRVHDHQAQLFAAN